MGKDKNKDKETNKESLAAPLLMSLSAAFENADDAILFFDTQKSSAPYYFNKDRKMFSVTISKITLAVMKAVFADKDDPSYLILIHKALEGFIDHGEKKDK